MSLHRPFRKRARSTRRPAAVLILKSVRVHWKVKRCSQLDPSLRAQPSSCSCLFVILSDTSSASANKVSTVASFHAPHGAFESEPVLRCNLSGSQLHTSVGLCSMGGRPSSFEKRQTRCNQRQKIALLPYVISRYVHQRSAKLNARFPGPAPELCQSQTRAVI